jgi:hypothetical protein
MFSHLVQCLVWKDISDNCPSTIVRYSENSRSSRETTREIHTPIEIRNITLSNGTYPRIGKIQSWLRKKCDAITFTGNDAV